MDGRLFGGKYVELDEGAAPWDVEGSWARVSNSMAQAVSLAVLPFFWGKLQACAKGSVFLDIGANGGAFTLLTAHVPGVFCMAFEPNPYLAASLERSVEANGLEDRVSVQKLGLGNATIRDTLYLLPAQTGLARLSVPFEHRTDMQEHEVLVIPLDSLKLPCVDLMKIDVEGMELFVLQGGEKTIREHMPGILMEWWPPHCEHYGYHPERIDRMLEGWGYSKQQVSPTDVYYERSVT